MEGRRILRIFFVFSSTLATEGLGSGVSPPPIQLSSVFFNNHQSGFHLGLKEQKSAPTDSWHSKYYEMRFRFGLEEGWGAIPPCHCPNVVFTFFLGWNSSENVPRWLFFYYRQELL
jgi:hypothetical protein